MTYGKLRIRPNLGGVPAHDLCLTDKKGIRRENVSFDNITLLILRNIVIIPTRVSSK